MESEKTPEQTQKSKKSSGCGCLVILIIIFFMFVSCGDEKKNPEQHTSSKSVQQTKTEAPQPYIVNVDGRKIEGIYSNNVGIAIAGISKAKTLGNNPVYRVQAQGEFIIVKLVISNGQKDAITVSDRYFKIIDDKNREFGSSSEAYTALATSGSREELFSLREINPGITTSGFVVFDVPHDITGTQLQVLGRMTGSTKMLPLRVQKAE